MGSDPVSRAEREEKTQEQGVHMAVVDPKSKEIEKKPRFHCREGRALFAITKYHRENVGRDDKPMVHVAIVCVKDQKAADPKLDPEKDEGLSCKIRLFDTDTGRRHFGLLARALKYNEPFDTESDDDLDKVFSSNGGIFWGKVKVEKEQYAEVTEFAPYVGEHDPEWAALIEKGELDYDEMMARKAQRQDRQRSTGGGGGGGGRPSDDGVPF